MNDKIRKFLHIVIRQDMSLLLQKMRLQKIKEPNQQAIYTAAIRWIVKYFGGCLILNLYMKLTNWYKFI